MMGKTSVLDPGEQLPGRVDSTNLDVPGIQFSMEQLQVCMVMSSWSDALANVYPVHKLLK